MFKLNKKTIGDMFDETVGKYPNNKALWFQGQEETYAELKQKVDSLAKGLIKLGVKPGERVAIWMPNYPEWIYTSLANAKIGAVTVPINIRFRAREVEFILKHSGVSTVVMADKFLTNHFSEILYGLCPGLRTSEPGDLRSDKFTTLKNVICLVDNPGMLKFSDVMKQGDYPELNKELRQRQANVQPEGVVNMFYTSGTTGLPKGAMADHMVLMNIANYNERMQMSDQDIVQIPSPLFYTTANYWTMLSPIMAGAKMCLCTYFTTEEKLEQISKQRVTVTVGMSKTWIDMANLLKEQPYDTSSLRIGWTAGAVITLGELELIANVMKIPHFINLYGMTETAGITTMTQLDDTLEVLASTIGVPLPNFQLKIVDTTTGETLPSEKPGELCVKGPYVIKGYLNLPKEEEAIYFDKDGWYHTQDIVVRHDNGYYSFIGRIKDMLKVGGENVSLSELDQFLRGHTKVKMAATIGVPDRAKLEVPLAFVEPMEGQSLTAQEILDYCKGQLAPFKIPKYVRFIKDWPVTPTGKIQRFKLKELVQEGFQFEK